MGAGDPAALNACVNTRDGSQVAAMSDATLDRVFDACGPQSFTGQSSESVSIFCNGFRGVKLCAVRTGTTV